MLFESISARVLNGRWKGVNETWYIVGLQFVGIGEDGGYVCGYGFSVAYKELINI